LVALQKIIDYLFLPFSTFSSIYGLAFATLLVTAFALFIYKCTSNQDGIKKARERIKAHFVEVWLFIDDPILILKAQAGIFSQGVRYLSYALIPLAIMFLPVLIFLVNCEYRYDYRPFQPDEIFLLKMRISGNISDWTHVLQLKLPPGLELTAPPLRFQDRDEDGKEFSEIDYRLKVKEKGDHIVKLLVSGQEQIDLRIFADALRNTRLNPVESARFSSTFLHPGLGLLKPGSGIEKIEVQYPVAYIGFLGWKVYWIWPFLILMFIFAFALKPFIRVEF
jgi:hypothetical protein